MEVGQKFNQTGFLESLKLTELECGHQFYFREIRCHNIFSVSSFYGVFRSIRFIFRKHQTDFGTKVLLSIGGFRIGFNCFVSIAENWTEYTEIYKRSLNILRI